MHYLAHLLPGFIIKAEDARGHYSFECTGVEQSDGPKPLLFNGKGSESISRRDLNKVYERYAKDPVGFIMKPGNPQSFQGPSLTGISIVNHAV